MRILITGASGYIGTALLTRLSAAGHQLRCVYRSLSAPSVNTVRDAEWIRVADLELNFDWSSMLSGVDVIVHLAAHVHVGGTGPDNERLHHQVNSEGTRSLATAAVASGVKRFLFVSSVKVHGETNLLDAAGNRRAFSEVDVPAPADAYSRSKWAAEQALAEIAGNTGLQVTVLRPPLVYGPNVGANFLTLLRWVDSGVPLPFAAIENRRSFIYVQNLVDVVAHCLVNEGTMGETFLVSDGDDLSTAELIRRLALALEKPPRGVRVRPWVLQTLAGLVGRAAQGQRLLDSLFIDDSKLYRLTGWTAPYSIDTGLKTTADWYRGSS